MSRRLRTSLPLLVPLLALVGCGGCELVTGPTYQIRRVIAEAADAPLLGEGTKLSVRFITTALDVKGGHATAWLRGEVEGTYRGVETRCLTVEVVTLSRGPKGWAFDGFPMPRMAAVVDALEGRRRALEAGDLKGYLAWVHSAYADDGTDRAALAARLAPILAGTERPRQDVVERVMRIDRDKAVVTETFRLKATVDGAPVEREGRARYTLAPEDGKWRFTSGLM